MSSPPPFPLTLSNRTLFNFITSNCPHCTAETYSRFRFRVLCRWLVDQKWFDNVVLFFIGLNCITLAMERPNIPPDSGERLFLSTANYIFTAVFAVEMFVKVKSKKKRKKDREIERSSDHLWESNYNLPAGCCIWYAVRLRRLFYFRLERYGRSSCDHFHNRLVNVPIVVE